MHKYLKHLLQVVIILFSVSNPVISAHDIEFRHITDKDGLYYNWIWDIYKDSEGFLWFSSQEGAFRYDGSEFETYTFKSLSGFPYLKINCVFEDRNSNIWFGTNEGLIKYQIRENLFSRYLLNSIGAPGSDQVNDIAQDQDGLLWIATGHGLFSFNTEQSDFTIYTAQSSYNSFSTNAIRYLLIDSREQLWLGGYDGVLYQYIPHNNHFLPYRNPANDNHSMVRALYEDHQGYIWIGYEGAGAAKFNTWSKEFVRHYKNTGEKNQIANNFVRGIVESHDHTIWFGTEKGLSVLDQEKNVFTTVYSCFDNPQGLNDNAIYSLFKEENGDIWIGTFFGGVNVFHNKPRFIQVIQPDGSDRKISGRAIGPIINGDNQLWIGTEDNGVNKYNPSKNTFQHLTSNNSSLSYDNIHSLCIDHLGNLWAGTYTGGLNMLPAGTKQFIHYFHSDDHNSISNNSTYKIFNDSHNNLWLGTRSGLNKYNYRNNSFKRIHSDILGGLFIWDIEEDNNGNIWICSFNQGVFMLDKHNDFEPEHISLPADQTITITMISSGQLLIGTEKQGLIIYCPDTKDYKHLTMDDSLPDNTIYAIIEDNSQSIWLTTNNGLAKTRDFNSFEIFTVYDGLPTNRFNYNSAANVNGKLYFGSTQGLVIVNPELQGFEEYIPKIHFGSVFSPDNPEEKIDFAQKINYLEHVELKYVFSSFSISYTGINLRESKNLNFAVMMEGVDKEWDYVGNNRIAKYNNLKPGLYRFKVRTADRFGELQDNERSLIIRIKPPWWNTVLAKTLYSIILITVASIIMYLLYARARVKLDLQLEKMEKQKIKDVNDAKMKFFTNITHEFKTPLTLIKGPINRLINDSNITDGQRKWYLSLINKNSERLLHLINELMGFRNVNPDQHELKLEKVDIKEIIENISDNYYWLAESNNISFTIHIDSSIEPMCLDAIQFEKILSNLLINAFNNTPKDGYVIVEVSVIEGFLKVIVKNSGKGIPPELIAKVFDRNFSQKGLHDLNQGTGIGLAYTKTLVELHKGTIKAFSLENTETSFIVKIPVNLKIESFGGNGIFHIPSSLNTMKDDTSGNGLNKSNPFPDYKPRILIVEDVKELRDFLFDTLNERFRVLTAVNGLDAFKLAQAENPDLIICDVVMPKLNGYELCSKIKTTFSTSHIRVLLLTVLSEDTDKIIGYKSGADAFISKPFDIELLILRINNLLRDSFLLKQKFQSDLDITLKEITYSNPDEELFKLITETVYNHIENTDFDLTMFAQEIGLSKSTLYRKMKSITGLAPNKFVMVIRLKRAAQLLKESSLGISEVAYEVGFSDPYYFSRAFKENFNISPTKFREQHIYSE